jgi:hypothetical protein
MKGGSASVAHPMPGWNKSSWPPESITMDKGAGSKRKIQRGRKTKPETRKQPESTNTMENILPADEVFVQSSDVAVVTNLIRPA